MKTYTLDSTSLLHVTWPGDLGKGTVQVPQAGTGARDSTSLTRCWCCWSEDHTFSGKAPQNKGTGRFLRVCWRELSWHP